VDTGIAVDGFGTDFCDLVGFFAAMDQRGIDHRQSVLFGVCIQLDAVPGSPARPILTILAVTMPGIGILISMRPSPELVNQVQEVSAVGGFFLEVISVWYW